MCLSDIFTKINEVISGAKIFVHFDKIGCFPLTEFKRNQSALERLEREGL